MRMQHLFSAAMVFVSVSAQATVPATRQIVTADGTGIVVATRHMTIRPHSHAVFTPPLAHRRNMKTIFSDFAVNYPKAYYDALDAVPVSGPGSIIGQSWFAAAFTPASNASVQEIDVTVGYISGTHPVVQVHLYADASGLPGAELWSAKTSVPNLGTCCSVVALRVKDGIALAAGTQYWLGVTPPADIQNFWGGWSTNVVDQVHPGVLAYNEGNGWTMLPPSTPDLAFGLYGK